MLHGANTASKCIVILKTSNLHCYLRALSPGWAEIATLLRGTKQLQIGTFNCENPLKHTGWSVETFLGIILLIRG